jgi:hypothetical protein
MSWLLTQTSLWKARNSNLVEVRVQYRIWLNLRKKDGTTGVCWEKWHTWRMDVQRISHAWVETSPKCVGFQWQTWQNQKQSHEMP